MELRKTTDKDGDISYWTGDKFIGISGKSYSYKNLQMVTVSPSYADDISVYVKSEDVEPFMQMMAKLEERPI